MVTHAEFPPDIRIEKEAEALARAGHEILVFTPSASDGSGRESHFLIYEFGFQSIPVAKFTTLRRLFKQCRINLVHLQDTPRSLQTLFAARSLGLTTIYDMHDVWPSLVLENSQAVTYKNALWSANLRVEEAFAFTSSSVSLTVIEEAANYLQRKYHQSDKVFSIRNFESVDRFKNIRPSQELADEQDFKIAYVGGLDGPIRGLQEVILAAALLSSESVQFLIVGSGGYLGWLERLTRQLNLQNRVRFLGWKGFNDAMEIVAASDLCLVPHKACNSTQTTLPHKISQYMALRKPVISTDLAPISRLFQSTFIKWVPRSPGKLAELITSFREDKARREEFGGKGYKIVSEKYRWEDEAKKLVAIYENLSSR